MLHFPPNSIFSARSRKTKVHKPLQPLDSRPQSLYTQCYTGVTLITLESYAK